MATRHEQPMHQIGCNHPRIFPDLVECKESSFLTPSLLPMKTCRPLLLLALGLLSLPLPTEAALPPPAAPPVLVPTLLSPAPNAVLPNGTTDHKTLMTWDFSWKPVPGATSYELWVAHTGSRLPMVSQQVTTPRHRHASHSYVARQNLQGWKWKVRAKVAGVWQPWSTPSSFRVRPPAR